ncbi:MAG: NUDIX hydrolase [Patescibacteria group bacterium]
MELHYFIGQKKSPFHLSVGAVVTNKNGEVACHHERTPDGTDIYYLMRETVRPGESLEGAVQRGLREEFGILGAVEGYLGSLTSTFKNWERAEVQKTTLYFLCKLTSSKQEQVISTEKHFGGEKYFSWEPIPFLVDAMQKQYKKLSRSDFDESEILKRIQ